MFRFAFEILTKLRVLGRDADGAGIFLTDTHHQAADGHERSGGKAVFLRTEEGGDGDIAAGLQLAVSFHNHAAAEVVEEEDLIGFCEAQLPWGAGVVDRRRRRRACATVVTGDQNDIGVGLGNAGRDGSHSDFRNKFHIDAGAGVGVFQVVDQFG